jgi:ribosomal protein S6--L-glutamate ligase
MRLFFLLTRRVPPIPSPVLVRVCELLRARGFRIEGSIAEEALLRPDRLGVEHDLYVLKSHTELSLSVAGVLDTLGARLLNPYMSCMATQDKIVASRRLYAAGVPAPRSWVTADPALLRPLVEKAPVILKPHRGHRGAGISIVRTPRDLDRLELTKGPLLVQEYVRGTGEDLKVYVVGEQVFAVRKRFSRTSFARPGRPCRVVPEIEEIALACGRILGLGLYGLDVIEAERGPVVVDVNTFPGYKGVPGAAPLIAEYIEDYAHGRVPLAPPDLAPDAGAPLLNGRAVA